jgi:predicted dehydrogenase
MRKVRLGILGVSWWTDLVYPGFALAENAEITYVAARSEEKAETFARANGIPHWSDSYAALIESPEVDAVFVGVPNFLHEEMAIAALGWGKHVLQEKPMALTTEKAVAQLALAQDRGLVLMVNQELRLADGVREVPELLSSRLGPLRKLVIGLTLAPAEWGGWRADPALSGGTLFEMVIHELDLARWLWKRDPVAVYAQGQDVAGKDLTVILDFGNGDTTVIDVCWRCIGFRLRAECYCEGGYLTREVDLPFGDGRQVLVTAEGREESAFVAGVQGQETFKRVLEGFADAILNGVPVPVPAEDGVWAVRMAEAARESLRSGKRVSFSPSIPARKK